MPDRAETETPPSTRPQYRTARLGGRLLAGAGWILALLGLAWIATAAWLEKGLAVLGIGALTCVSGGFMVVTGQLIRATVDSANQTREILQLLRSGPLQWATHPPSPPLPAAPPERTPEQTSWLKTPSTPISADMRSSIASENVSPCVNPFCARLLPEGSEICPHCKTRQKRLSY
ncbi:hypothetical protein [Thiocystis violacea]|uniref:hypothetical protein n=1 Tax=Thiocystis violacea TaxID=13725 RepID=UPI001903EB14|nr:hypothetical protein [Thiocystis violacea]MBK1723771.1 hypothetical protein [Thiocystis violacea]